MKQRPSRTVRAPSIRPHTALVSPESLLLAIKKGKSHQDFKEG
jgi:hypothetical protein